MTDPPYTDYPPAPWHSRGRLWTGFFPVAEAPTVPERMKAIAPGRLVVLLLRYQEGTLTYDELMIGFMARQGRRAGLSLHGIWVDDLSSLWGGRQIWGVPKQRADFAWSDDSVNISGDGGVIAEIALHQRSPAVIPARVPLAGFGSLKGQRTFITGTARCRPAAAELEILRWSDRLPALRKTTSRASVTTAFTMTVPPPKILSGHVADTK